MSVQLHKPQQCNSNSHYYLFNILFGTQLIQPNIKWNIQGLPTSMALCEENPTVTSGFYSLRELDIFKNDMGDIVYIPYMLNKCCGVKNVSWTIIIWNVYDQYLDRHVEWSWQVKK